MVVVNGHIVDPESGLNGLGDIEIDKDMIKKIYLRSRG